jgi:CRP-like cAMP-binding protein
MNTEGIDMAMVDALAFLDSEEKTMLQSLCAVVELPAGGVLFRTGDAATAVYFLVSGRVAVQKNTGFAEKMQVVALLDAGAPVGEGAAVTGQRRGATVVAIENCRLFSIEGQELETLRRSNPNLAWKIMTKLLHVAHLRLQKSSERLAHIM